VLCQHFAELLLISIIMLASTSILYLSILLGLVGTIYSFDSMEYLKNLGLYPQKATIVKLHAYAHSGQ